MTITPHIFEAYLKCPMKCWLLATGKHIIGNTYAEWVKTQTDSYRVAEAKRLLTQTPSGEHAISPCSSRNGGIYTSSEDTKSAKWRLAIDVLLRADESQQARNGQHRKASPSSEEGGQIIVATVSTKQETEQRMVWGIEARLHAIERVPSEGRGKSAKFVPIRFSFQNKLTNDERMMLAFDALVLSEVLGRPIGLGKIIYGGNQTTLKIKTSGMSIQVQNHIKKIITLLSSHSAPDISLIRHCTECEFRDPCRKIATEKDDLSLLSNMSEKERQKLQAKGIFTVTQLSYTFRPRRRAKKQTEKQEKFLHSLKALAIREKKIHVVGSPELKIQGMPVYLDVEGLPDRDFYYLIGMRISNGQSAIQHSLWANDIDDEKRIWNEFLGILASVENPVVIHYGSYETTFFTRMLTRHGAPPKYSSMPAVFERAINLVSVIFAKVYYPTYSNGLKDIARYLGFKWSDAEASGLNSIVWRHQWEETRSDDLEQKLFLYNAEDCAALERVADTVRALYELKTNSATVDEHDFINVDSLKREKIFHFGKNDFALPALEQINKAGYWDYQRSRIFLRTDKRVKAVVKKSVKCKHRPIRINQTIELLDHPSCCPKCGCQKAEHHDWIMKTIEDLKFSKSGIKSWVVRYRFLKYICYSCHSTFYAANRPWQRSRIGSNLRSYILYQLIELRIPQTTVDHSLNQLFGMSIPVGTAAGQKRLASKIYENTYKGILNNIVAGKFIHADETKISIDNQNAYVWVFANHDAVAYVYTDSREGGMVQELLLNFKGVLISDFYSAYDSIDCPQQKCLVHLIRDLNEDYFKQPFNDELKNMVREFSELLKSIVETIDRFGLKAWFLRKHKKYVDRFNRSISGRKFKTEIAIKYQKRFEKYADKLFTFLDYDNVPWNNNNAEHAIKPFAKLRHVFGGVSTPKAIHDYLVLLSVAETCKYRGISFLDFLRSGELDIDKFSAGGRSRLKVYAVNNNVMG